MRFTYQQPIATANSQSRLLETYYEIEEGVVLNAGVTPNPTEVTSAINGGSVMWSNPLTLNATVSLTFSAKSILFTPIGVDTQFTAVFGASMDLGGQIAVPTLQLTFAFKVHLADGTVVAQTTANTLVTDVRKGGVVLDFQIVSAQVANLDVNVKHYCQVDGTLITARTYTFDSQPLDKQIIAKTVQQVRFNQIVLT